LIRNGCNLDIQDQLGKTALHYASELGQDDTLELLLAQGANPNIKDFKNGKTPLFDAVENG
jgi:ankyrin repeat protein